MSIFASGKAIAETPDSLSKIFPSTRITKAIDENSLVTLGGNRPAQLDSSEDKGAVDDNLHLEHMKLILSPSPAQKAALAAFSKAQLTRGAPEYHHWLTPAEFASHFGASAQDIETIKTYLLNQGFSIDEIPAGKQSIIFSGTAAQVNRAFHTEIHDLIWHGEQHIANINNPQIPTELTNVIGGIVNLHDFFSHSRKKTATASPVSGIADAVSLPLNDDKQILSLPNLTNGGTNYLTPGDYGVIYDINPLYSAGINGKGVSIAVLGRSDILTTDVASFQSFSGLPAKLPQILVTNTDPGYVSGDQLESTLDVEWAGGVAPGADILFITSASTTNADGVSVSAEYAVNNNVGDIVTLSYGLCEPSLTVSGAIAWADLWYQAQVQGQTVLVAAGDAGAAGCDSPSSSTASYGAYVNGLCSSAYSTCVGGTEFLDTSNPGAYWHASQNNVVSALRYIPEKVWNDSGAVTGGSELWASGGGKSIYWAKPNWQVAPGVPADNVRDVPDVAMTASLHDGYIVYLNGQQYAVGGTSAGTPSLAAIIALMEQYNGVRQGNINPTLYGLYQLQAGGSYPYFHPTVSGNNSVPGQYGYPATGAGYNLATGLGSVDANLLVREWHNFSNAGNNSIHTVSNELRNLLIIPSNTSVSLSSSSLNVISGQTLTFTAAVSGDAPTGSVQFLNNGAVIGNVTISNGTAGLTTNALIIQGATAVVGVYAGDNNNLSSSSNVITENVLTASAVSLSVTPASVIVGQTVTLSATVTGTSPTGTVRFYVNGVALGLPVALSNGVAILTTTAVTNIGQDMITASYSGDSNNAGNVSLAITETVVSNAPAQQVPAFSGQQEMLFAAILFLLLLKINRKNLKLATISEHL